MECTALQEKNCAVVLSRFNTENSIVHGNKEKQKYHSLSRSSLANVASHANVLRGSSRVPEPPRTSAWEAIANGPQLSTFDFRSQEDVVNVQITHEKPEKFVDKVSLRSQLSFLFFSFS